MNWITKLERKFGRYCIPNLISILIGGQILVYAVELFVNQYISFYLNLDRGALLAGQIWRVITFVFVPFSGGGLPALHRPCACGRPPECRGLRRGAPLCCQGRRTHSEGRDRSLPCRAGRRRQQLLYPDRHEREAREISQVCTADRS